jgi:hypothetical protein
MIRNILIFSLFFALVLNAKAQFDPLKVKNSVVRVVVTVNATESNVLTGFVWKSPNEVVTSLHGMSRSGNIKVLYLNNAWRDARIKKVLQKADLVLLELIPGQAPVPSGVTPITSFSDQPIRFGTEIYAIGYNSGAQGSSSRTLKKGFVDPETLANLIPQKDKAALARIGFPTLDLNILYLEGSLLPGYSGSPVFDPSGRLIGVGDGGLEKGASNVSWIIPAKYLNELEASTTRELPPNFDQLAQLFSAKATIDASVDDMASVEKQLAYSDIPKPIETNGFEFYLTKNRSINEMVESSDDAENMLKFADEMEEFNVTLDYESMRFDIYEDINNGVVLAVPEGQLLYYDAINESFNVSFPGNDYIGLSYAGVKDDFSTTDFEDVMVEVQEYVNYHLAAAFQISGFVMDEEYSYWLEFDDNRKIAWLSSTGNEPVYDAVGNVYAVGIYLTLLMSNEKTFMAISTYIVPVEMLTYTATYGLDCNYPGMNWQQCEYFNSLFKVFSAAHLTTFAW